HQDYRSVPGLLQAAQHHDSHHMPDMQAGAGGIESDIGRDRPLESELVEALGVRDLVNESAFREKPEERRAIRGHGKVRLVNPARSLTGSVRQFTGQMIRAAAGAALPGEAGGCVRSV